LKFYRDGMTIVQPPLPYALDALEPHLSAETFEYHYGKHHATYVATVNELIDGTPLEQATLDEIVLAADGKLFDQAAQVWNHNLYFASMRPGGGGRPDGPVGAVIDRSFGDYETFRKEFTTAAAGQFGSGWVWLTLDGDRLAISTTGNADLPLRHGGTALLTCDVWEHAYYVDYRNRRADYVDVFLDHLIDWSAVDRGLSV
jgi:Fe-Mn family superoxide dismutase